MEHLIFAVNIVFPLFIMILLGYLLTVFKLWNASFTSAANKVCFKVFFPILLFNNIYQTNIKELFDGKLILFTLVSILLSILFSLLVIMLLVREDAKKGVIIQTIFRSNFILFGMGIAGNIYGPQGVGVTATLVALVVPVFNLSAVVILALFNQENQKNLLFIFKDIIKNPLIIGSIVGMVVSSLQITFPSAVQKSLNDLSGIATPLALLILGGEFGFKGLKKNIQYIFMGTIGRLIIVPLFALTAAVLLGFRDYKLVALLAAFASPTAVSAYIMAAEAGADSELAGQLVVITTFLSPLTLCLFIYAFKSMGLIL
ncbi:MAG: transporter [Clostridia bacterium]|nr:transporter [Clostridia bacterium]